MKEVASATRAPTVIDLFCGAGGMTHGFVQAGFAPVFAIDADRHAVETYRANFGDHATCADIRGVERFPSADVVVGGPPCQGFSRLARRTHGAPTPDSHTGNALWAEFMRCVAQSSPTVFVVENVPDFFDFFAWHGIKSESARLGYHLSYAILNAADYGVSQRRRRAIIVGNRRGPARLPPPTHAQREDLFASLPWRTVRDAFSGLPLEPDGRNRHDARAPSDLSRRRYAAIPPGGNWKDLPADLQPACWRRKGPTSSDGTDVMGRLAWDAPALTVRTEFLKPEKGRYLHPEADRSITVREGARLQGFPDDFIFSGSNHQAAKQIGNAVPPPLAACIAHTVRELVP